jgi:cellulose synthase/poly-beta-1,6-N-acetylglucosamine synthase-like glycosyltransferase
VATIFLIIGATALLFAVHPFLTYPLSLALAARFVRPQPLAPGPAMPAPRMAICCCAFNEGPVIEAKARNMIEAARQYPATELWVYIDGATDDTAARLAAFGDRINVVNAGERHGKSYGMNTLVQRSQADIIIFTDANVMFRDGVIANLGKYFEDPAVGCVCGFLQYDGIGASGTALAGGLYWRLEEGIKQLESDTGSVMGADGSLFVIRRSLHTPVPADVIDDMFVSLDILCRGYRVVRAPDVVAHELAIPSSADEFRRKIRITCQAMNVHRLMWPRIRRLGAWNLYKYVSHKLIRWFAGLFLLLAAIFLTLGCLSLGVAVQYFAAMGLLLAVLVLGAALKNRWSGTVVGILSAFLAALVGILESMRGKRYQVWSPADSIRTAKEHAQ